MNPKRPLFDSAFSDKSRQFSKESTGYRFLCEEMCENGSKMAFHGQKTFIVKVE